MRSPPTGIGLKGRSLVAWGLVAVAIVFCSLITPQAAAQGRTGVGIDPLPYYNSVPSAMLLGHSYRLVVVLHNNGTNSQSGSVIINFDQNYFFTSQGASAFQMLPGDTDALNFTIVATNIDSAPLSVSAYLVVNQGVRQVTVQEVTATVYSISRDPGVYTLAYVALGVIVLAAGAALLVLVRRASPAGRRGGLALPSPMRLCELRV